MLLRTVFVLMLLFALSETMVHGAHALAQVTLRRQASVAVHDALLRAVAAARTAVAGAIAAGGDPRDLVPVAPSPVPACAVTTPAGCVLTATAWIAFSPMPAPAASPCADDGCTVYQQGNDSVAEGRLQVSVAARATGPDGTVLATRSERVTFRTFRIAPYAALAGDLDGSLEALAPEGQGDDGGAVPNGTAPGTLIDVTYENRDTGASMPANVWQPNVQRPADAPPPWAP
ncbi:MAG: hypothetical protein JO160_00285 [Candidatus Eremiobacteraeota bacterium]|nr:hypothetical protein [Candidatus Eremiobacteraeota bacterium]MBV8654447.1 hypothetical protein [Candidatus Eremiobacteraeota bacterium]